MAPRISDNAEDILNRPPPDHSKALSALKERAKKEDPAAIAADLAKLFPSLRGSPGIAPWKPEELDQWAASGGPSSGTAAVVRFLFAVWNGSEDHWKVGPFRLADLHNFDINALAVFQAWAADPFWL